MADFIDSEASESDVSYKPRLENFHWMILKQYNKVVALYSLILYLSCNGNAVKCCF